MRGILVDLRRNICSMEFVLSILGIVLLYFLGSFSDLERNISVLEYFLNSKDYGVFTEVTIILGVAPCVMRFADDFNSNYIKSLVVREGVLKYSLSKLVSSCITCFITITVGIGLFLCIISFILPEMMVVGEDTYNTSIMFTVYGELLTDGKIILYFINQVFFMATVVSMLCPIGMFITTKLSNKFLGLTVPMMAYYFLKIGGMAIHVPTAFSILSIRNCVRIFDSNSLNYVYCLGILLMFWSIFGILFYRGVKKNVEMQ